MTERATQPVPASRAGEWMQTFTGGRFYPLDPRPDEVRIEDIAHALANTCRFGGHCPRFYSVAEHAVIVARQCSAGVRIMGLLHDAAEAYAGDLIRPLKRGLPAFADIEERILCAIAERFGVPWPFPPEVKRADDRALAAEAKALFAIHPAEWGLEDIPIQGAVRGLPPEEAEQLFLQEWHALSGG